MAKSGRGLVELATEIQRRAESKADYVAPVEKLEVVVVDDKPALAMQNGTLKTFDIGEVAHGQVAEYAGIPMAYYRRMMADDPQLLATNVNRWLRDKAKSGERRLVRTLDGRARAMLSSGYRPLENEDLAEAVLPVLQDRGLLIVSCEITERRLYLKAVDRNIQRDVPTGKMMGDGTHTFFDTVSPAIIVSNSEVGYGRLSVEWGVWTKACTNLAAFGTAFKKAHVGTKADVSDEVYAMLTDETRKASDQAVFMQVRDMVSGAFDEAKFDAVALKLGNAAKDRVEPEKAVEVIERVGRKFQLNEGERKGVLAALIRDGDLSRYGVHSAITRFSQEEVVQYDRATELERLGGEVIDMPANDWRALAAA